MRINELITLYGRMRMGLIVTAPIAMWGFMLWLSGGEMLPACLFGIGMILPIIDILPSATEVRRTLKTRETTGHIWYMIEDKETGKTRVCK